jgi:hypothetical protein
VLWRVLTGGTTRGGKQGPEQIRCGDELHLSRERVGIGKALRLLAWTTGKMTASFIETGRRARLEEDSHIVSPKSFLFISPQSVNSVNKGSMK